MSEVTQETVDRVSRDRLETIVGPLDSLRWRTERNEILNERKKFWKRELSELESEGFKSM
jgi:deoxyribodipyrimidine photolyase-like uncharacterized protein